MGRRAAGRANRRFHLTGADKLQDVKCPWISTQEPSKSLHAALRILSASWLCCTIAVQRGAAVKVIVQLGLFTYMVNVSSKGQKGIEANHIIWNCLLNAQSRLWLLLCNCLGGTQCFRLGAV